MKNLKNCTKNSFKEELPRFLSFLDTMRGYSSATRRTYEIILQDATNFIEFVPQHNATLLNLMPYRFKIASQKKRTIAKKLSAIRSYVRYLEEQGYTLHLASDTSIKVPQTLPKPLATTHIDEALSVCDDTQSLIILVMFGLGLRVSELSHLRLSDISSEWIRVRGKGDKSRDIPLVPFLSQKITHYIQVHTPKTYLMEHKFERLSENALRYRLKKCFAHIGIHATPHQLRHSYATELLNGGSRITDVSQLLGHSHLSTTQIYTKLHNGTKMDNYLHAHPLCKVSHGN